MRVPDLCYLIFDLCDDGTLVRLAMTCSFNRRQLVSQDASQSRALAKGYLVRILHHKYEVAARKLDLISIKMSQGILVDVNQQMRQRQALL